MINSKRAARQVTTSAMLLGAMLLVSCKPCEVAREVRQRAALAVDLYGAAHDAAVIRMRERCGDSTQPTTPGCTDAVTALGKQTAILAKVDVWMTRARALEIVICAIEILTVVPDKSLTDEVAAVEGKTARQRLQELRQLKVLIDNSIVEIEN